MFFRHQEIHESIFAVEPDAPRGIECPIGNVLMADPVMAADGISYERVNIETWFQQGHNTSPVTGEVLPHLNLVANVNLKQAIEEFLKLRNTFRQGHCRLQPEQPPSVGQEANKKSSCAIL